MNQATALDILKTGHNVFLTGSAGAGKTYVLNKYIEWIRDHGVNVAITASTGIAATHINGQTIHSWSGIGIKDELTDYDLQKMFKKHPLKKRITQAEVLIIDEISMLSKNLLTQIDRILKFFRVSFEPFGGMQVIFSGDFFQLPPVSRERIPNHQKFAFMAPIWKDANLKVCYLTEQYRQSNDDLSALLNDIRSGEVSDSSFDMLSENMERAIETTDHITTKLYTHNADVDKINQQELEKLSTEPYQFFARVEGTKNLTDNLQKSILAPALLTLKEGAQVMFVKNNYEEGYMNGTTGIIIGFEDHWTPIVETLDGREIRVKQTDWVIEDEMGKPIALYAQIPLRLAWAITIHKSQGMTLDSAEMDLSKVFEPGQGYVALSRVKTWSGLRILGCNPQAFILDELAMKADKRFQELSYENEQILEKITQEKIQQTAEEFILHSGGTLDPTEIEKNHQANLLPKFVEKKEKKKPTHEITKDLVEAGNNLVEIMQARDLSEDTILSHLEKINKEFPEINLEAFKPDPEVFEEIEMAHDALKEINEPDDFDQHGHIKLKTLYEQLEGIYSYRDIKRARIFL